MERAISPRTRLIVVTNLHNPTGVRTPDSTLKLVGEIARSLGAHVLVDEVYLEVCFDSPGQSAFHLGPNFIATSSLTKAYGLSGLRCGWILAAPALAERMWRLNDLFGVMPAHPAELISVVALDQSAANRSARQSACRYESHPAKKVPRFAKGSPHNLAGGGHNRVSATNQWSR